MGFLLDDLSRVAEVVDLPNKSKVRVRALSDFERREADMQALAVSARLVERLRDSNSTEYQAYILPVKQASIEKMREALLSWKRASLIPEIYKEIQPKYIPWADGASDEERRDVVLSRSRQDTEIAEKRKVRLDELAAEYAKTLESLTEADLLHRLDRFAADGHGLGLYQEEFVLNTVYAACEVEDGTARYYNSVDDVRLLSSQIRNFLYGKYLEVDRADPFALPLPSVTESSTA